MRGEDKSSGDLFSYKSLDDRVYNQPPLRLMRDIVNDVLARLSGDFAAMYSRTGRPSIPPEELCGPCFSMPFGVRSERQLMEQLDFNNMLFRWFFHWTRRCETPVALPRIVTGSCRQTFRPNSCPPLLGPRGSNAC